MRHAMADNFKLGAKLREKEVKLTEMRSQVQSLHSELTRREAEYTKLLDPKVSQRPDRRDWAAIEAPGLRQVVVVVWWWCGAEEGGGGPAGQVQGQGGGRGAEEHAA